VGGAQASPIRFVEVPKVATLRVVDERGVEVLRVEGLGAARMLDVCDEHRAPISFSCRSATCGVCRVFVARGHALLQAPTDEERATLADLGAPADVRLACRVELVEGDGIIEIRPLGPPPIP
jgi:2Fe-2S ferredoxin